MKSPTQHLTHFYDHILQLYPAGFREEYAEEMLTVFQMQLGDTQLGSWKALRMMWDEIRPLPGLLFAAHWRERRISPMKTGLERWFVQPEGSWKELLLVGLPFVMFALPGVFALIDYQVAIPSAVGIPIIVLMALTLIVVGMIGFFVRLPRWSLVYAGAFLTLITLGGLSVIGNFSTLPINWGSFLTTAIFLGIHVVILFLVVAGMIWISGKIPLTADFRQKVTADPSLISLLMYGGTLIVMVANFEDVTDVDWYLIAAALVMLLGAWGYLRTEKLRTRLLSLVIGNTVATALGLAANLLLVDYGTPPVTIGWLSVERVILFIGLTWITSLVMILLPPVVFRGRVEPVTA